MSNQPERTSLGFDEVAVFATAALVLFLTPAFQSFGLLFGASLLVAAWTVTLLRGTAGSRLVSALGLTTLAFVVLVVAALGIGSFA